MKILLLLILNFLFSEFVYCEDTYFIKCKTDNSEYKSEIEVNSLGQVRFEFFKKSNKQKSNCQLTIAKLTDASGDVVPFIDFEFIKNSCVPVEVETSLDLTKEIFLTINTLNSKSPRAKLHWLKSFQPDFCQIEKISLFDLKMSAEKWKNRKWGTKSSLN